MTKKGSRRRVKPPLYGRRAKPRQHVRPTVDSRRWTGDTRSQVRGFRRSVLILVAALVLSAAVAIAVLR